MRATIQQQLTQSTSGLSPSAKAKDAARRWLKTLEQSSTSLISCPNCHSPTPKPEIARWNLCYHCVAAKWSDEYCPPTFPEPK